MSAFGLDARYFYSLRFLNEVQSLPYWLVYISVLIYTGAWKSIALATVAGLAIAILLQRFVLSRRCDVPKNAAILITGCSSGIGFHSAISFAELGFHVYATVRKQEHFDKLSSTAPAELRSRLECVILDVVDNEQIKLAAASVAKSLTSKNLRLQSIINNAGYAESAPMEMSAGVLEKQFQTNVFGLVSVTNAFLPMLRDTIAARKADTTKTSVPPPSLINISSVVGRITVPMLGPYCASKYAVESISDSYRAELYTMGINTVMVEPGAIATEFTSTTTKSNQKNVSSTIDEGAVEDQRAAGYYAAANLEFIKSTESTSKLAQPPVFVTSTLAEAVLSPSPLARYRAGIDSNIMIPFLTTLPDAIITSAYLNIFKTPAGKAALEQSGTKKTQ